MRIVITGGSGLIGRRLTDVLSSTGDEVVVTSRTPERVEGLPDNATAAAWDGSDPAMLAEVLAGADGVVHLLGAGIADARWTDERKREIVSSRTESSRAVAAAMQRMDRRPGVLIQGSASGYYGHRGTATVTENDGPGSGFLPDTCQLWEAASAPVEALGVRRVIARTGVVLSRDGGALPKMLPPFRLGVGGRVGDGQQGFPWIHEDDQAQALAFLLRTDAARGPFNLAAPGATDNADFTRALGRVLRRPTIFPVPAFVLRIVFGEMSAVLLEGARMLPAGMTELGFEFQFPTAQEALADLLR